MAGGAQVAFDITAVAVSTAVPGIAWTLWYVLAWRRPAFAESLGLGRAGFWLLLPGALLASFALLPIAPVSNDILAVSFAGGVFPLLLGLLTLDRIAPPLRRSVPAYLLPLLVETGVLLGLVLAADAGALNGLARSVGAGKDALADLLVAIAAAVASASFVALALGPKASDDAPRGRIAGLLCLTNAVLVLTFVGSQAIPGVGISEAFPYYLLPPFLAGCVAAALARRIFPGAEAFALPASFLASCWGVLLGADVLRQPPLYGHGAPGLYAIGGAGVFDLVYLSGFLGLAGAWAVRAALRAGVTPVGPPLPVPPASPTGLVRKAYTQGLEGRLDESLRNSALAADSAARQAGLLLGKAHAGPARPWEGLAVPGWVVSDTANLASAARAGTRDPREAVRAWLTARELVKLAGGLSQPRFASIGERLIAFGIDAGVLGAGGSCVLAGLVLTTPGGLAAVLSALGFNAAIYGLVAVSLLYFALAELWGGATFGKRWMRIEVRDRRLRPVGGLAALVRNAPLLPAMTLFWLGLALGIALGLRGFGSGGALSGLEGYAGTIAVLSLVLVFVAGIAVAGVVGLLVMRITAERQRVGDLWAGTWVVRRATGPEVPPPPPERRSPSA